jgi:hypothetical protein
MAKLRINGDSSGYVDLEAPNAASSSTLDLDQVPQKNVANTFSEINKFAESVAIGGTHSPSNNLDVRSTGQAIVRVDGAGLYYNGIKIRNNYSSVQSDWNIGAAGGTSGWGSANGTFIIRDDTTNSTGLEIEQGAGSNTAALHINSSGYVTTPEQPAVSAYPSVNGNNTIATGDQTLLPFGRTLFNNGNHYNTSTNIFTAPVAGYYFTSANARWETASFTMSAYIRLFISKNDGDYNSTRIHVINGNNEAFANYMAMSCSGIVYCSAGDTLRPKGGHNGGTSELHGESSFHVYLLG